MVSELDLYVAGRRISEMDVKAIWRGEGISEANLAGPCISDTSVTSLT